MADATDLKSPHLP